MKLKSLLMALIIAIFATGAVFAQDPPAKSEPVNVGILTYMDYTVNMSDTDQNTFNLTRAYLMVSKKFSESWSAKMVLDASKTGSGTKDGLADTNRAYAFLKALNVVGKTKMGPLNVALNFGVIDTPYVAYMAGQNGDYWINGDAMLTSGNGADPAFDLGVGLNLGYGKLVSLYTTVSNGDTGFKDLEDESDYGKAVGSRLSITPLEGLAINFFFFQNDKTGGDTTGYIGGGVAYKTAMIKAGVNYLYYIADGAADKDATLDAWVNANLKSVIGMPLLASVHYVMQDDTKTYGAGTAHVLGLGLGYQATKGLDAIAYYSYDTVNEDHILSIRSQVKF